MELVVRHELPGFILSLSQGESVLVEEKNGVEN